jgi:hypothetical protein
MARRDLTGAVDFGYLEDFASGDSGMIEEVLDLFREQTDLWRTMLEGHNEHWRDALHALKGSARGVGAFQLGDACETAEGQGPGALPGVHAALDAALFDIAAYKHEQALKSLRG